MAPDPSEWTIPGPLRALLWWPATAFVLVVAAPDTAAAAIAVAGGVLATVGAVIPLVLRRTRAPREPRPVPPVENGVAVIDRAG